MFLEPPKLVFKVLLFHNSPDGSGILLAQRLGEEIQHTAGVSK
jgi:hypothetical protein